MHFVVVECAFKNLLSSDNVSRTLDTPHKKLPFSTHFIALQNGIFNSLMVHKNAELLHLQKIGKLPLLTPFVSLRTVHSSMVPNELNITRTSLSLNFLETMPTNNFRSGKERETSNQTRRGFLLYKKGFLKKLQCTVHTVAVFSVGWLHLNGMMHLGEKIGQESQ